MVERIADGPGSASWVRARLVDLRGDPGWAERQGCRELVDWLYVVVRHRARRAVAGSEERDEVTQDAMVRVVRALTDSRDAYERSNNPAAVLERVAARAVGESRHRVSMCGLSGIAANGRNWRARFPRKIGGESARLIFEALPATVCVEDTAVTDAASRIGEWIAAELGAQLSTDGLDALVYVLDRLVAGVSRSTLLRGGRSALGGEPSDATLGSPPKRRAPSVCGCSDARTRTTTRPPCWTQPSTAPRSTSSPPSAGVVTRFDTASPRRLHALTARKPRCVYAVARDPSGRVDRWGGTGSSYGR